MTERESWATGLGDGAERRTQRERATKLSGGLSERGGGLSERERRSRRDGLNDWATELSGG
jgi:hypothetical protein